MTTEAIFMFMTRLVRAINGKMVHSIMSVVVLLLFLQVCQHFERHSH